MPDTYIDCATRRPVTELRPGDRVDLQLDAIADAGGWAAVENGESWIANTSHPEWEFEWEVVAAVERETADCIRVDFESGFSCGFPADWLVEVDGEQVRQVDGG
jgi:hypothetical protein